MATATLRPNADGTLDVNQLVFPANGVMWDKIDEVTADGDTTYAGNGTVNADVTSFVQLDNTPGDVPSTSSFTQMDFSVRAKRVGTRSDDNVELFIQIFQSDETTAITNEISVGTWTGITTSFVDYTGTFSITGTNTKAVWDGARIRFRWVYTKVKSSDSLIFRITQAFLTGTYTPAGNAFDETGKSITITSTVGSTDTAAFDESSLVDGYVSFGGTSTDSLDTTDKAALRITGDIDVRILCEVADTTPATQHSLIEKWGGGYALYLKTDGKLEAWTARSAANDFTLSTATPSWSANQKMWLRYTRASATGDVNFYESEDGTNWTQIGTTVTDDAGAINAGTAVLSIWENDNVAGKVYAAEVRDGINGTVVANPDFRDSDQGDWSSPPQTDDHSNSWDFNGSAAWTAPSGSGGLLVSIASTVTGTDSVGAINYDETGKALAITSTLAASDGMGFGESVSVVVTSSLGSTDSFQGAESLSFTATSSLASTDTQSLTESLQVTAASTIGSTDTAAFVESTGITITSSITGTDTPTMIESVSFTITSSIEETDATAMSESLDVSTASTLTSTDTGAFGESVSITTNATVEESDTAAFTESLDTTITSAIGGGESTTQAESLAMTVTSSVSETDVMSMTESGSVVVTSTVAGSDLVSFVESLTVSSAVTLAVSDSDGSGESLAITITSTLGTLDTAAFVESLDTNIVSTVEASDSTSSSYSESVGFTTSSIITSTDTAAFDDTGLEVSASVTVSTSDSTAMAESPDVSITATLGTTDGYATSESLEFTINATLSANDVYSLPFVPDQTFRSSSAYQPTSQGIVSESHKGSV